MPPAAPSQTDAVSAPGPISESDFFTWEALIMGPKDTPFEGGVFAAKLTFVSAARSFPHATNEHNAMHRTAPGDCAAARLPVIALQDEVRAASLSPEQ